MKSILQVDLYLDCMRLINYFTNMNDDHNDYIDTQPNSLTISITQ